MLRREELPHVTHAAGLDAYRHATFECLRYTTGTVLRVHDITELDCTSYRTWARLVATALSCVRGTTAAAVGVKSASRTMNWWRPWCPLDTSHELTLMGLGGLENLP